MVDSKRMDYGEASATLDLAREAGVTAELWDRFRSDASYRQRLVELMRTGACAPSRRGPLPVHFGPLEWETFFKVRLTPAQWAAAENFPWPMNLGDQPCPVWRGSTIGQTHFAFFGIEGITTEMSPEMRDGIPAGVLPMNVDGIIRLTTDADTARWFNRPRIVNNILRQGAMPTEALEMRWYCIPMDRPIPTLMDGHAEITPQGYQIATMAEYLAAKVFYFLLYTRHYQRYGTREYAPYAICGAPARQQQENRGLTPILNQMVSQGQQNSLAVGYTQLTSGAHDWFTALARIPQTV